MTYRHIDHKVTRRRVVGRNPRWLVFHTGRRMSCTRTELLTTHRRGDGCVHAYKKIMGDLLKW